MPFVTLELDETLAFTLQPFASDLHRYLSITLDIPIERLKTKLHRVSECYVGQGEALYARLLIELKAGRETALLQKVAQELLTKVTEALKAQNPNSSCRVTVEFQELHPKLLLSSHP